MPKPADSASKPAREAVSEADRAAAVEQLRRHVGVDHLSLEEFSERAGHAYAAETKGQLERSLAGLPDLPDEPDASPGRRSYSRARLRRSTATFVAVGSTTVGAWGLTGGGDFWPGWLLLITAGALAFDAIRGHHAAFSMTRLRVGRVVVTALRSKNTQPAVLKVSARRQARLPVQPPPPPIGPVEGHLELDNVSFRHPGRARAALQGVSLDIAPGEHVALFGPSGAGKSTVLAMLSRLFDPSHGTVRVDGRDLREFAASSIRRRLQTVGRETFLFDGSLRANVAYGLPDISDREIERVLRSVGAWDRFRAAGGLQSQVSEHDRRFGPDDRRLIALTRVLLAHPDVLLVDDVAAGLDAIEQERALDAILAYPHTVVLATTPAVAARARRAIVLEAGRIVAAGAPDCVVP